MPKFPVAVRDNRTYRIHQPSHEVIDYQSRFHVYLVQKVKLIEKIAHIRQRKNIIMNSFQRSTILFTQYEGREYS